MARLWDLRKLDRKSGLIFIGLFHVLAQAGEPILLRQFQAGRFDALQFVILRVNILSAIVMRLTGIKAWRAVPTSKLVTI
jgi:hypothetical protein